jgi:hypothetical protein
VQEVAFLLALRLRGRRLLRSWRGEDWTGGIKGAGLKLKVPGQRIVGGTDMNEPFDNLDSGEFCPAQFYRIQYNLDKADFHEG